MNKQPWTRQDYLSLVGIILAFLALIVPVITPELRATLGIEQMTSKQVGIFIIFFLTCALIWQFGIWRLIRSEVPNFLVVDGIKDNELALSNIQMFVSPDGKVTLRTVISAFNNGIRRPVKKLKPANFLVVEHSEDTNKKATIVQAKPMTSPMRMVILIDVSASMWGETQIKERGQNLVKIEVVKRAVLEFTSKIIKSKLSSVNAQPSYVAFLPFSSEGVFFITRNNNEDIWFPTLPESLNEIEKNIKKLNPDGKTPMLDAVSHAISVIKSLKDDRYKILFCLTDGIDNDSEISNGELNAILATENIPVITAGYGNDVEIDEEVLGQVSSFSGAGGVNIGSFSNVKPRDLSSLFNQLANDLNNTYEISWYSGFSKVGQHVIAKIQASFLSVTGEKISPTVTKSYVLPKKSEHQI